MPLVRKPVITPTKNQKPVQKFSVNGDSGTKQTVQQKILIKAEQPMSWIRSRSRELRSDKGRSFDPENALKYASDTSSVSKPLNLPRNRQLTSSSKITSNGINSTKLPQGSTTRPTRNRSTAAGRAPSQTRKQNKVAAFGDETLLEISKLLKNPRTEGRYISDDEFARKVTSVLGLQKPNSINQKAEEEKKKNRSHKMINEVIEKMGAKASLSYKQSLSSWMKGEKATCDVQSRTSSCGLCSETDDGNFIHNHMHRIVDQNGKDQTVFDANPELKCCECGVSNVRLFARCQRCNNMVTCSFKCRDEHTESCNNKLIKLKID